MAEMPPLQLDVVYGWTSMKSMSAGLAAARAGGNARVQHGICSRRQVSAAAAGLVQHVKRCADTQESPSTCNSAIVTAKRGTSTAHRDHAIFLYPHGILHPGRQQLAQLLHRPPRSTALQRRQRVTGARFQVCGRCGAAFFRARGRGSPPWVHVRCTRQSWVTLGMRAHQGV